MQTRIRRLKNHRAVGVACAVGATGLGLLYMTAAGAPTLYLAVNASSLVLGLGLFAVIPPGALTSRLSGGLLVALGGLLPRKALP